MNSWKKTRTGSFALGFRRLNSDWQKDLPSLLKWSHAHSLGVIDLGADADVSASQVLDAGLTIGSADLGGWDDWRALLSPDPDRRKATVEKIQKYIETCTSFGIKDFFFILVPENPGLKRQQNLSYAIESLSALEPVLSKKGARIAIEGWPGPGVICCTPESYRAFFEACPSSVFGVNYDPSHLLRMWIDPIRFLDEFQSRIYHVHGKDTDINLEDVYQYGIEQPPTLASTHPFGGTYWRYTIPGQGLAPWGRILKKLVDIKYNGSISIELEDSFFNRSPEFEETGFLAAAEFLKNC